MAGSLFGSMAGTVLGTMIAQNFLAGHGLPQGDLGHGHEANHAHETDHGHDAGADTGDLTSGLDDIGADFDGGSFDV